MEKLTVDLEKNRKLERVIVHVDMDAFYAAVEMRDCPELKNTPMAVGSMSMLVRILVVYYDVLSDTTFLSLLRSR